MIFAKLFLVGENDQILFTKAFDSDEDADLITVEIQPEAGISVKQNLGFHRDGQRNEAFDFIDQEKADAFYSDMTNTISDVMELFNGKEDKE